MRRMGTSDEEPRSDLPLQRQKGTGWHGKETRCEEEKAVSIMGLGISFVLASYKPLPNPQSFNGSSRHGMPSRK